MYLFEGVYMIDHYGTRDTAGCGAVQKMSLEKGASKSTSAAAKEQSMGIPGS